MASWARRIAQHSRICDSCWDHIRPETTYYLMSDGRRFCEDCEPEEGDECPL